MSIISFKKTLIPFTFVLLHFVLFPKAYSVTIIEMPMKESDFAAAKNQTPDKEVNQRSQEIFDFQSLEKIYEIYDEKKKKIKDQYPIPKIVTLDEELKNIITSKIQTVLLVQSAILVNIKNDKLYKIPREIFINIYQIPDKFGFYLMASKKSQLKYKIHSSHIMLLDDLTDLKHKPQGYIEYDKKMAFEFSNIQTSLTLTNHLNFHYEFIQSPFAKQTFNTGSMTVKSYRLENLTYIKGYLPLEWGVSFNGQAGNASDQGVKRYNWLALYAGPMTRFPLFTYKDKIFKFHIGIQRSLRYQLTTYPSKSIYNISNTVFEIGPDMFFKFLDKQFMGSLIYRRNWIYLEKTSDISNKNQYINHNVEHSIGLSIGHTFDANL